MARNAWEEDPDILAMRGRSSGTTRWSRVFWGLLLVGMGTFAAAYYLPLFRAHDTLTAEHRRLLDQAQTDRRALESAQAELKRVTARRDELEAERQKKDSGDTASQGALDGLRSELSGKLDKLLKKGAAEIGSADGKVVVGVADAAVFSPHKLELNATAKPWLCDLANVAGSRGLRVRALDDDEKPGAATAAKYPTTWTLRAARAATVTDALEQACSLPGSRIELLASGGNAHASPALANSKLPASHLEFELGSK